jgi:transposase
MEHYIGIDVSKEEFFAYEGTREFRCKNAKGCLELKKHLKKIEPSLAEIVLIFEATGPYSQFLREFCARHAIRACIVNPMKSSSFTKALGNRSKTDVIDAAMLYELHKVIKPEDILVPRIDQVAEDLSHYLTSYELLLKTKTSLSNHLHALSCTPKIPKELIQMMKRELQSVKDTENKLLEQMERYIESHVELAEDYRRLLTIKGVGRISAISFLTLFRTYPGTSRSEITALVGLDPTRMESGTSVRGRRKISKGGKGMVRKILYFPTLNCIQHNKVIRNTYDRLVSNHKPKKLAVIAAMRKLLLIAHAVYKTERDYCEA